MSLPFLSAEHFNAFVLVLLRVSAIIVTIPVISEATVPAKVKAALSIIVSLIIFPLVASQIPSINQLHFIELIFRMIGEVLIGVTIGFVARLVFAGIRMAGDIIGFQMGFSVANVIDPMTSQMSSVITELQYLIAMLVFLTVNAHHLFFQAIIQSYALLAPLSFHFSGQLMQFIFDTSRDIFVIALKISAPIMAVMIFTNVGLGVMARTVPQMNIFIVGFPLQISLGLIFLGITAPLFVHITQAIFISLEGKIVTMMRLM
ncbi:MAG: flagellar biosynthetic protein FliR [Deltaproteobacteria bacterium HGW-Deltaproteobacteria-7]|nr:MAG: flagellar biosynthetic protein FliR [Deltaproteobacteria bacterium HGW-Deltaproteobacteria-7]PKN20783.1 MAG: flagellar biosynthetic protein FliR [Deltaproteobacteria bacterium HGW-Deltaproteobacteria-6]